MSTTEIKIEKGIPIPESKLNLNINATLRCMQVGDSIFLPGKGRHVAGHFPQARPSKFIARTVTEDGVVGKRIWRTA